MLKQLVEAIRPSVSRLESQLTEAEGDLAQKRSALDAMLIDGQIDGPAAARAADAVDAAERRTRNLRSALQAARERQRAAATGSEQESKRLAWQAAVKAAEARHAAVEKLAVSMSQFAADYQTTLQANADLLAALPANPDNVANLSDRFVLETALRKELVRLGLPFAFVWPYGAATLPELMPQFDGALAVIKRSVPEDLR